MVKKKVDTYVFPAVFSFDEGQEIAVIFPDLDVATSGVDEKDAFASARELLGAVLYGLEEDNEEIPTATPINELKLESGEIAVLIDVFMPSIRLAETNKSINRTVTLPAWLNAAALEKNINFSQVLQDALKSIIRQ